MTREDSIKILNFLHFAQATIFSADDCESVKGFYCNETKMMMKNMVRHILKKHGEAIKNMWANPENDEFMADFTNSIEDYSIRMKRLGYFAIPAMVKILDEFEKSQSEESLSLDELK